MADKRETDLNKPGLGALTRPQNVGQKAKHVVVLTRTSPGVRSTQTYRLHKERVVIGSVDSADVPLGGDGVSPIHAVIEAVPSQAGEGAPVVTAYDLASDSGVFVNGRKIVTQELKAGDELTIGLHKLKFGLEEVDRAAKRERVRESSEGRKLFLNPNEDLSPLLLEDEREVEEIFDYAPTAKLALEVVMSWRDTILDIEHFTTEKAVTIGNEEKSDFGIPPLLSSSRFPIVTRDGENFRLNLDTQMTGVLHQQQGLRSIDEVRSQLTRGPYGFQVQLSSQDFAKIRVGEVDFYFSFTQAPPRLKSRRILDRDPLFLKLAISSLLFTALMIVGIQRAHVPQALEAEQLPDRIATILYQPEKYVKRPKAEKPVPQPEVTQKAPDTRPTPQATTKIEINPSGHTPKHEIPKEMGTQDPKHQIHLPRHTVSEQKRHQQQNQGKEGQGARHTGKEGTRGSKNSKNQGPPQNHAQRPSPGSGKGGATGNSQIPGVGNIDFLRDAGSKVQNLLGNSAAKLGKGGQKLSGFGVFTTQGGGGLALSGNGKGGGGTSDLGQGLGKQGLGGGRVGTGLGATGNGTGIIGGKGRVLIRSGGPEEAVVMGAIDADAVEAALLAHKDEFRYCYEKEINAEHPKMSGRVGTTFVIGASGRVNQAGIESTSLKNANVERCILAVIKRIEEFPIPRGGGVVQVSYPFKFSSIGK